MDPSFDRKGEYARVVDALTEAQRRFATGVCAFWYPLMEPAALRAFERALRDSGVPQILQLELWVHPADWSVDLRGCGLLVVNPPFGFAAQAREILPWLVDVLAKPGSGGQRVRALS
jgi:23S rRNA (adenine2030-N6)-methyltransferase